MRMHHLLLVGLVASFGGGWCLGAKARPAVPSAAPRPPATTASPPPPGRQRRRLRYGRELAWAAAKASGGSGRRLAVPVPPPAVEHAIQRQQQLVRRARLEFGLRSAFRRLRSAIGLCSSRPAWQADAWIDGHPVVPATALRPAVDVSDLLRRSIMHKRLILCGLLAMGVPGAGMGAERDRWRRRHGVGRRRLRISGSYGGATGSVGLPAPIRARASAWPSARAMASSAPRPASAIRPPARAATRWKAAAPRLPGLPSVGVGGSAAPGRPASGWASAAPARDAPPSEARRQPSAEEMHRSAHGVVGGVDRGTGSRAVAIRPLATGSA